MLISPLVDEKSPSLVSPTLESSSVLSSLTTPESIGLPSPMEISFKPQNITNNQHKPLQSIAQILQQSSQFENFKNHPSIIPNKIEQKKVSQKVHQPTKKKDQKTELQQIVNDKKMYIAQGFYYQPRDKQLGGKDNREALPRHVVKVNLNLFKPHLRPSKLRIKASLYGYKRLSRHTMELDSFGEQPLTNLNGDWGAVFDSLIVKHSSHNHGQRLFLRFVLLDDSGKELCSVDSSEFETITRRGIESK